MVPGLQYLAVKTASVEPDVQSVTCSHLAGIGHSERRMTLAVHCLDYGIAPGKGGEGTDPLQQSN